MNTLHGGKRAKAGKKPFPPGVKKVSVHFRLQPRIKKFLDEQSENNTELVEKAILHTYQID